MHIRKQMSIYLQINAQFRGRSRSASYRTLRYRTAEGLQDGGNPPTGERRRKIAPTRCRSRLCNDNGGRIDDNRDNVARKSTSLRDRK